MRWMQSMQDPGSNKSGGGPKPKGDPRDEPKVVHQGVAEAAQAEKEDKDVERRSREVRGVQGAPEDPKGSNKLRRGVRRALLLPTSATQTAVGGVASEVTSPTTARNPAVVVGAPRSVEANRHRGHERHPGKARGV